MSKDEAGRKIPLGHPSNPYHISVGQYGLVRVGEGGSAVLVTGHGGKLCVEIGPVQVERVEVIECRGCVTRTALRTAGSREMPEGWAEKGGMRLCPECARK